ncbi:unnamed protein product [Thelazia callipaeda]|uniref:Uncharacterized protein n=1 Tax=Thelazia callipaeda TaxID=103827 RepID=A0A3P7KEG2_THECL|nr:unnamed protein product [Thelazia callipaeda]
MTCVTLTPFTFYNDNKNLIKLFSKVYFYKFNSTQQIVCVSALLLLGYELDARLRVSNSNFLEELKMIDKDRSKNCYGVEVQPVLQLLPSAYGNLLAKYFTVIPKENRYYIITVQWAHAVIYYSLAWVSALYASVALFARKLSDVIFVADNTSYKSGHFDINVVSGDYWYQLFYKKVFARPSFNFHQSSHNFK